MAKAGRGASKKTLSEPTESDVTAFVALLEELAPQAQDIWGAVDFAARCIDQYREALGGERQQGDSFHADRASAKKELQALGRTLRRLQKQVAALSPAAKKELPAHWTSIIRRYIDEEKREVAPKGQFMAVRVGVDDLGGLLKDAENAVGYGVKLLFKPRPNKHFNPVNFLAAGMHQTLSFFLGVKPAMTRARDDVRGKSNSANYARLLQSAIKLGGGTPPDDLLPIMKVGRAMDVWSPAGRAWAEKGANTRVKK